jgi:hypothetical protein
MYEEATAHLEDIFQNETLVQLRNNSLYDLKEIRTSTYGLLYSICHLLKTSIFSSILLKLIASRGNYEVFLYPKGNEFWFNMVELAGNISLLLAKQGFTFKTYIF